MTGPRVLRKEVSAKFPSPTSPEFLPPQSEWEQLLQLRRGRLAAMLAQLECLRATHRATTLLAVGSCQFPAKLIRHHPVAIKKSAANKLFLLSLSLGNFLRKTGIPRQPFQELRSHDIQGVEF